VQRRRKQKAVPRNVFGSGSQPKSPKKESVRHVDRSTKSRPPTLPPTVPGKKLKPPVIADPPQSDPADDAISEPAALADQTLKSEDSPSTTILENQLLGDQKRQTLGLSKPARNHEPEEINHIITTSDRAKKLIESSKERASSLVNSPPKPTPPKVDPSPKPQIKPRRKFRSRVSSYQPAARARRLDRSRHMEYKYEMRLILSDMGILEEHRSNLLATIWARGERQTTKESKDFLNEKLEEGIIDDEQRQTLEKIVDNYTVRR